jgi:prepilin-type N-terminal cleavage/methylation domain-containing protein
MDKIAELAKINRQRGIGLLELMMALAIIAILIIMATRYFGATTLSQKINTTHMQIIEIIQGLRHWKAKYGNYADLTSINQLAGLVSPEILENKDPFGAATGWVISYIEYNKTVTIRLNGIPPNDCEAVRARLAPLFRSPMKVDCTSSSSGKINDLLIMGVS